MLPISTVNMSLNTAVASKQGFGTPAFVCKGVAFQQRVNGYADLLAVGKDFSATHPAYVFAQGIFHGDSKPALFKVALVDSALALTIPVIVEGASYSLTVTDHLGVAVTATEIAGNGQTQEALMGLLETAIESGAGVTSLIGTVSGTGSSAALVISSSAGGTAKATVAGIKGLTETYTTSETQADSVTAIRAEDDDWFFVGYDSRVSAEQVLFAAQIDPLAKAFFTASQDADSINAAYTTSATDLLGLLRTSNSNAVCIWSHDADAVYPEAYRIGNNATFAPDVQAVVWAGRNLKLSVAKNALGNQITPTQMKNLDDRYVAYVVTTLVGDRQLGGKTSAGQWFDEVHAKFTIQARVKEATDTIILNQEGKKLPGGARGVQLSKSAIVKALTPFVAADTLVSFEVDASNAAIDQGTRTLSNMTFKATFSGAILRIVINGSLVNQEV